MKLWKKFLAVLLLSCGIVACNSSNFSQQEINKVVLDEGFKIKQVQEGSDQQIRDIIGKLLGLKKEEIDNEPFMKNISGAFLVTLDNNRNDIILVISCGNTCTTLQSKVNEVFQKNNFNEFALLGKTGKYLISVRSNFIFNKEEFLRIISIVNKL